MRSCADSSTEIASHALDNGEDDAVEERVQSFPSLRKSMLNKRITREAAARCVALEPRVELDRHALTYNGIHLLTVGRVVDLLQVDRSGVYLGVQAGATVVGVQGELSRALSAVWGR